MQTLATKVSASYTTRSAHMEQRLGRMQSQVDDHSNRIVLLESHVKQLQDIHGAVCSEVPPKLASDPGFDRTVDDTIIIASCKQLGPKKSMEAALRELLERCNVGPDDCIIEGDPTAKRYIFKLCGPLAPMRAAKWLRCWVRSSSQTARGRSSPPARDSKNSVQEVSVSGDRSAFQIKRELACKQARKVLEAEHPDLRFFTEEGKGDTSCQWNALVRLTPVHSESPPQIEYSTANLQPFENDKRQLAELFENLIPGRVHTSFELWTLAGASNSYLQGYGLEEVALCLATLWAFSPAFVSGPARAPTAAEPQLDQAAHAANQGYAVLQLGWAVFIIGLGPAVLFWIYFNKPELL
ncbi:unnamed protein product [Prorocentrum cordatum]|uniref:Uncharacterized protein n=1 Tax=Prorocentrum cordatum TaxID=2364126 RepID=A0ABN9T9H0_9DINO|nr:unnamed protein product [Polarella glacialis]